MQPPPACPPDGSFLRITVTAHPAIALPERLIEVEGYVYNPVDGFYMGNVQLRLAIGQDRQNPVLEPIYPDPVNVGCCLGQPGSIRNTWVLQTKRPGYAAARFTVSGEIWCQYFYYVGNSAATDIAILDPAYQAYLPLLAH